MELLTPPNIRGVLILNGFCPSRWLPWDQIGTLKDVLPSAIVDQVWHIVANYYPDTETCTLILQNNGEIDFTVRRRAV